MRTSPISLLLTLSALTLGACDSGRVDAPGAAGEESKQAAGSATGLDSRRAGTPLPAIELSNSDREGDTLAAQSGEPVLVNLWATWCAPCVKELPTLQALASQGDAPRVIAVSQDLAPRGSVDAFVEANGLSNLEIWHDPDMALSSAIDAQILPTTILYDSSGREVWRYVGDLDWTGAEARAMLGRAR